MDLFSDSDNFSDTSGSEEQDELDVFYGGHACSILSSLEETIGKIDDFLSFERGFMHGDVVRPVTNPSGQMGKVINVNIFVDLENRLGKIIKEVNSRKIQKVRSLSVGDYVVLGPWLGKVDRIIDCVSILFDDGTKSEFTTAGPEKILPVPPDLLEDSQYQYYPGQRVRVVVSSVTKPAKWLCGTRKEKHDEGTVFSVEAGLVSVNWLACALMGHEKIPVPPYLHDSKKLTMLSCFSHTDWQMGDWCMLPNADPKEYHLVKGDKHTEKVNPKLNEMLVITKTKTIIDVMWQDGTCSFGLDCQYVEPVNFLDAHDFCPDQFVMEKVNCDDPEVPTGQKWGVVRSVNAKERTVRVSWKTIEDFEREQIGETVSAYELVEHPDYSYCLGDVVFRFEKKQSTDVVSNPLKSDILTNPEVEGSNFGGEQNILLNDGFLSSIGIVMGFKAGNVEVKWAIGDSTEVAPYEIFRMDKYEGSSSSHVFSGENVQPTEEMTGYGQHPLRHEMKVQELAESSVRSLPQAAIGIFTSIIGNFFGSYTSTSLSSTSCLASNSGHHLASDNEDEVLESINLCNEGPNDTDLEKQVKNIEDDRAPLFSSDEGFKRFDLVTDCLDHHFVVGADKGLTSPQVRKGWLKKVQQEWSILEKDLPETIYVRAYEERMDLLRAVIIGAPATPYHDGLFFFDIFLPLEYPHEPPSVHYNSGGLRVNPNLYESGKVCLSLLNTWTGADTEVWNPTSSTILQVLLSLQALVLNEKPYFNEAGYDKQMGRAEAEKNSVSYNENAFLVSCKSMLYLLRKPPKHFEAFVEEHFRQRSKNIVVACKAYMEGAPVGCAFGYEKPEHENQEGSSTGFKMMLSKLYPKLVQAFSEKGIDCSPYEC